MNVEAAGTHMSASRIPKVSPKGFSSATRKVKTAKIAIDKRLLSSRSKSIAAKALALTNSRTCGIHSSNVQRSVSPSSTVDCEIEVRPMSSIVTYQGRTPGTQSQAQSAIPCLHLIRAAASRLSRALVLAVDLLQTASRPILAANATSPPTKREAELKMHQNCPNGASFPLVSTFAHLPVVVREAVLSSVPLPSR